MIFIMGSQLKSRGAFSAQEGENWLGKPLAHLPANHRRSFGNQESNETLWFPSREDFLSYFA